jgi:hypothetical protein
MFVVYTFCAWAGALFAWLRVAPAPADPVEGEAAPRPQGCRRIWALPLCLFGLLGLTLHLLDRPFLHTLLLSLAVGPPVGLLAGWISGRIDRDRES